MQSDSLSEGLIREIIQHILAGKHQFEATADFFCRGQDAIFLQVSRQLRFNRGFQGAELLGPQQDLDIIFCALVLQICRTKLSDNRA